MNRFVVIRNGEIDFNNIIKNNIDISSLIDCLKKKKVRNIENVEILIFIYNKLYFVKEKIEPVSLIINGKVLYINLLKIRKSFSWIKKNLNNNKINLDKIIYAVYLNKRLYIIKANN